MKRSLLILGLLGLLVPSVGFAASALSGFWSGTAFHVSGDSDLDHETDLHMSCSGGYGTATYTYTAFDVECESTLTLESTSTNPHTGWTSRNYDDTTQTAGCTDGKVTLMTHPDQPNRIFFQWKYGNGTVDTEGWLNKTSATICLP